MDVHSCSYECDRPACIKQQRDELVARLNALSEPRVVDDKAAAARYRASLPTETAIHSNRCERAWSELDESEKNRWRTPAAPAVPEGWVLVPKELLADVEEQLVDLSNEKSSNRGIYREQEKLHDADVLQRVRLLAAALSQQRAVPGVCSHEWSRGYGVEPYCKHCGIKEADDLLAAAPSPEQEK